MKKECNHEDITGIFKTALKTIQERGKTKLGNKMLSKLKVYAGPEHPHTSQKPQSLDLYS